MSCMPPVPPANRTTKGAQNEGPELKEKNLVKHEQLGVDLRLSKNPAHQ